ncbi:AraC family transcriptional regulator [Sphingomonas laterariae]|uniref:AraC family transcriptional regulator n=1 Tax=Edaphosphingomonas laterariae TaxID=861865 RepID=A0A239J8P2_9SPHN|nr:helix-turn-helix transcriptional regulator [Sphingomonas laterariae]SNT01024.1 AraC family transcriptional regulator [Sphingomonas laterariae]
MSVEPKILAACRSAIGDVKLLEWHWPSPMDVTATEERLMIEMSLPPHASDGRACFPDIEPDQYSFMGNIFLRPAGVRLRVKSAGGQVRVIRCAVEPAVYARIAGTRLDWTADALKTCLNLRGGVLQPLLRRLVHELEAPGAASTTFVEACVTALIIETARIVHLQSDTTAHGRLAAWQYRKVTERLAEDGPLPSVSELAALCGVGNRHFLRLFRSLTGETASAFIDRARIDRARRLLTESELSLKEIAARLGFAHPSNFSTAFRRATNLSPTQFRQISRRQTSSS